MEIVDKELNPSCLEQRGGRSKPLRFSLRTLLVLVALAGAMLAAANLVRTGIRKHASVTSLVKLGAYVEFDDESRATDQRLSWDTFWFNIEHDVTKVVFRSHSLERLGTRSVLDRELVALPQREIIDSEPTHEHLRRVANFEHLTHLGLRGCEVTDDDIDMFRHLPLEVLDLTHTLVTDKGIMTVAKITTLRALYLESGIELGQLRFVQVPPHRVRGPTVTDAGVRALAQLPALQTLDLDGTSLFNESVEPLSSVRTLRHLSLARTWVLPSAIAALKKVNPQLEINEDAASEDSLDGIESNLLTRRNK